MRHVRRDGPAVLGGTERAQQLAREVLLRTEDAQPRAGSRGQPGGLGADEVRAVRDPVAVDDDVDADVVPVEPPAPGGARPGFADEAPPVAVARRVLAGRRETPEPLDLVQTPPMFVPLEELERLAPGTWYINVLAAYPESRGKGLGTMLIGRAADLAATAGCRGTSLIVADTNLGARRLYERTGHVERARRTAVKDGWDGAVREWVLLVRE